MAPFIKRLMDYNGLTGGEYAEVYAGGAGIAISLLSSGHASKVYINDLNPGIFAFWKSVFERPDELCRLVRSTPVSIDTWRRQRAIFTECSDDADSLELGFATFFLNRTNRSGILTGGVIGGLRQDSDWPMDVRYNAETLTLKIETISTFANQAALYRLDAEEFLRKVVPKMDKTSLVLLDPPYFSKSKRLYQDLYDAADHTRLAAKVQKLSLPWVTSYDDVPEVRKLYAGYHRISYDLQYSAGKKCNGAEALFFSRNLKLQRGDDNPLDPLRGGR